MALVSLKEILADARGRGYAVGSFNMVGFAFLNGILEAAHEEDSPVILNIAEGHLHHMQVEQFVPAALQSAQRARVPVAIHLDHGFHFETVVKAVRWGFTSVMYDGSGLSYEENLATTKAVTRLAQAVGVSVEAEVGKVGGAEGVGEEGTVSIKDFTDPDMAAQFVKETGIDVLAISVGNVHGLHRTSAKLDFDRIARIRGLVDVPLALHGGSGIPDESFIKAIRLGVCKVNYFTAMTYAAVLKIREFMKTDPKGYEWISLEAKNAIKEVVRERMKVFGSTGRGY